MVPKQSGCTRSPELPRRRYEVMNKLIELAGWFTTKLCNDIYVTATTAPSSCWGYRHRRKAEQVRINWKKKRKPWSRDNSNTRVRCSKITIKFQGGTLNLVNRGRIAQN